MKELTEKACLVYLTLKELVEDDVDFLRALIMNIETDFMKCQALNLIPTIIIEDWVRKSNYYFSDDEKIIIRQLLKQFGLMPMIDAVNKLYNQYCTEMLLLEMGINTVKKDEWDLKEDN